LIKNMSLISVLSFLLQKNPIGHRAYALNG